jgi:ribonuclease J
MAEMKFIALSGTTGATENLYVYEYGADMIVVDCGVGFPDPEMLGVDLVIPDFDYIVKNKEKLRGIVITHGHEDHLGALPFLLKDLPAQAGVQAPIYATRLTAAFIEDKLLDYGVKDAKVNVMNPDNGEKVKLGVFEINPFRISHSVPDGVGLGINTPEGMLMHVPDYKFDWSSVDRKPFDVQKAVSIASNGVLALASDALGSTTPGHTESEKVLDERIEKVIGEAKNRIYFTTISSNIARIQQAINAAEKTGRKVAFVGRSMERKAAIAKKLGYLHYHPSIEVHMRKAAKMNRDKVLFIISGCYGQPGSALYRVAHDDHRFLHIEKDDTVIFSADPAPPGSKMKVDYLVDRFLEGHVDVHYYDLQEDLHVSGHGSQEDIRFLFGLIKPKYFIPIGGTVRHMRAYHKLAEEFGANSSSIFELMPGDSLIYEEGRARKGKRIAVRSVLVDGLGIGDVGNVVLRDRRILSEEGFVISLMQLDSASGKLVSAPELITKGFVFEKSSKDVLKMGVEKILSQTKKINNLSQNQLKEITVDTLEHFFFEEIGRRPMILPVVVEV